jgi:hypothetical protein
MWQVCSQTNYSRQFQTTWLIKYWIATQDVHNNDLAVIFKSDINDSNATLYCKPKLWFIIYYIVEIPADHLYLSLSL